MANELNTLYGKPKCIDKMPKKAATAAKATAEKPQNPSEGKTEK